MGGAWRLLLGFVLLAGTAAGSEPEAAAATVAFLHASSFVADGGAALSDGVRALLRQEIAQVAVHTWGKRLAVHRTLDAAHEAAATLALSEAAQLVESLRAAARKEGAGGADAGACRDDEPDALPPEVRGWLSGRASLPPGASQSALRTVRHELAETASKAWETERATQRTLDRLQEKLVAQALAEVADALGSLREQLDAILMQSSHGSKSRQVRRYMVREAAVGLAWDDQAVASSGRLGDAPDDACELVEAGVDYPFYAFEMFRRVEGWRDCCFLCRRDPGCVYWTWAAGDWRVESQRKCCWLKSGAAKPSRRQVDSPGTPATIWSGSVPPAVMQKATSPACAKLPVDVSRNRLARDVLVQIQHTGRNWTALPGPCAAQGAADGGAPALDGFDGIPRHVFFIHYYDKLTNPLYLCAIESFLVRNPGHRAIVYAKDADDFSLQLDRILSDDSKGGAVAATLATLRERVVVRKVKFARAFRGTPLQDWYDSGQWKQSKRPVLDLCDAMRLALLYSIGGTYLDLDIMSLNRLDGLGRAMAAVDEGATHAGYLMTQALQAPWGGLFFIGNALFRFPPKDPFILAVMRELPRQYDPSQWANTGPYLITRVYERHCRKGGGEERALEHCRSLTILEPRALCPVFMFNNQVLDVGMQPPQPPPTSRAVSLTCSLPSLSGASSLLSLRTSSLFSPLPSSLSLSPAFCEFGLGAISCAHSRSLRRRLRMAGMWVQVLMRRWEERCYQMRDMARCPCAPCHPILRLSF